MNEISDHAESIYRFGQFEVDTVNRLLLRRGATVALTPKVFDMLLLLVENNGRMVSKDEIMEKVWSDTFVEETNLTSNISRLRKILHESGADYIETFPKRGYRFNAKIEKSGIPREMILSRRLTARIQQTIEETEPGDEIERPGAAGRINPFWKNKFFLVAAGLAILLAVGLSVLFWSLRQAPPENAIGIKSLAILPFKPLVAEDRNESLELGMTDTLISKLGSGETIVRPLSSVRRFGNVNQDAVEAGRLLGVDCVLDGSVQRGDDKIRVNVRLIRTADGSTLWSGTFDEKFTDIFVVQDAISRKVASALTLELTGDEKTKLEKRYTNNVAAYQLYLRGRYHFFKLTQTEIRKAIDLYQQAIDLDPAYALAYAAISDAYRTLPFAGWGVASKEAVPQAKAAAKKALEIDPNLAEAHIALGWVGFSYDWDWKSAESELKRAIELAPNNADAHRAYAHLLSNAGRHDEAIAEGQRARELDPVSLITNALEGQFLFYAGRDDEAIDRVQKTLEIDPNFWIAHGILGRIYIRQKRFPEAIFTLTKAKGLSGGSTEPLTQLGYALAKTGRREEALGIISELKALSANSFVPAYSFAIIYNGLKEKEKALKYLETSFQEREMQMSFINVDQRWDDFRSEPRFLAILKEMNFENK